MNQIASQHSNTETYVQTPIGTLKFYSTAIGGLVEQITILQCDVGKSLPEGMRVPSTIAVLLQFTVIEPITEFSFYCVWENLTITGYGNSGEGLEAWEWENENHVVMIGTEDPEYLHCRIPSVPAEPIDWPMTMEANKIRICLKELPISDYSLHYVVAWNELPEPEGSYCWLNLDLPHKLVRKLVVDKLIL
jgi:hypothetical protein